MMTYGRPKKLMWRGKMSKFFLVRIYDDSTGKRTWISTGATSIKAAQEFRRTLEMDEALGKDRSVAKASAMQTFKDAVEAWMTEKRATRTATSAYVTNIESIANTYWIPFFGKKLLRDVTSALLKEYLQKRKLGLLTVRLKPVVAATVNNDRRLFSNFLGYARRQGWIVGNPLESVEQYRGEMRRRTRSLSEKDEQDLLKACRESPKIDVEGRRNLGGVEGGKVSAKKTQWAQTAPVPGHLFPLVLTALRSGLRKRTLLSARWRHIDLAAGRWNLPGELLKTSKDYCTPVAASVVEELKAYRARLLKKEGTARVALTATIFGLEPTANITKSFQHAATRAGLKLTFHDLRRVFINRLRERGVPIDTVMGLSGHSSLATIMKHYLEVPTQTLEEALRRMEAPSTNEAKQA